MAKTKHDAKATEPTKPTKKVVSASGIFKKAKKQALRKDDLPHHESASKRLPASKGKGQGLRNHQHKVKPGHPLLEPFDASLKDNRDVIEERSLTATKNTTEALLQRFRKCEDEFTQRLEEDAKIDDVLYLPLANEGINYSSRDGSQSSTTTLGAQMKRFRKTIAKEEQELESLWQQLGIVQEELESVAHDVLGPDWAAVLPGLTVDTTGEAINDDDDKAFEKTRIHLEDLITTTSEQAVKTMEASEKEFRMKQTNQNQRLMQLFKETEAVNEE